MRLFRLRRLVQPDQHPDRVHEAGQILILFTIVLVVILGFAAIVVDLGVLRNNRQTLVNAMDAGALAGGTKLPVTGPTDGTAANALIARTVTATYPGITSSQYTITYVCLIGVDTSTPPQPYLSRDIPLVCDPSQSLGRTPVASDFKGAGSTRISSCDPQRGDKCNAVLLAGATTTQYALGPVVGVNSGSTGTVTAAACRGPCGESPIGPVDVVLIMDRTSSMSGVDTTNSLVAANAIRAGYSPASQWLALSLAGPSRGSGSCLVTPDSSIGTAGNNLTDLARWVPIDLSGIGAKVNEDYTLATSKMAVNLKTPCYANSSTGTDLADPMKMAIYELQTYGRTGVRKGIILETDGQPNAATSATNATSPGNYCLQSNDAATAAKNAGIEVFTIGFGLDGANDAACPDTSGAFRGKTATALLATMATQPSSNSLGCPGTGSPTTNTDGDHFFCLPKTAGASTSLASVFQAAAAQLATGGARLIELYPAPVVTAVSPSAGPRTGGGTVTITGLYFTGSTKVMFGGANATFTINSDTSITATVPAGTAGTTVDIVVTSPAGSSAVITADRYTYT